MITITFYDGVTSAGKRGTIHLDDAGFLRVRTDEREYSYLLRRVSISDRLGNTARLFEFPNGESAEALDNDAVDAMLLHSSKRNNWISRWEMNRQLVLVSIVGLVLSVFVVIEYGVPWGARHLASSLPASVDNAITEQTLYALDNALLQPSKTDVETQARLQNQFQLLTEGLSDKHRFTLLFRSGKAIGPNAFALPGGTIVLLDELIAIAENDDEIISVLAHEIGHVTERHGLRSVIQDSAVVLLIGALTGDVLSTSSLAALFPVLLVESKYSREFEREADEHAMKMMQHHGIALSAFPNILERMTHSHERGDPIPGFLSSHPATEERAERFRDKKL